jgi:hypothetical protein
MKQLWFSVIAAITLSSCSAGTPVAITNHSAAPIENVTIFGSGFTTQVGHIASGQTVSVRVEPTGESGLGLDFRSGSRQIHVRPQGYFEGGAAYKVSVVIAPDLSARVNGNLRY